MTPDFSNSAQKLARNPLGIIALFLLLVYGIAGLVFSVAAKGLDVSERRPLVWFLVLFPVLVLGAFIWLVARHHTKLYAPSDYRDAEGFFRALKGLTIDEQRAKLDAEVNALQVDATDAKPQGSAGATAAPLEGAPSAPDEERQEVAEVQSPAPFNDRRVSTVQLVERRRGELREAVVLAEELVFRKLEAEFHLPVRRHVKISGAEIDGLIGTPVPTAVEIKYVQSSRNIARFSHLMVSQLLAMQVRTTLGPLKVLLVVVVDAQPEERHLVDRMLERRVTSRGIEYRVYDFAALKEEFGVASG
jgi:hypothetical protein